MQEPISDLTNSNNATATAKGQSSYTFLYIVILLAAAFAACFPILSNGFVEWGDNASLLENELLKDGLSATSVSRIFTTTTNGGYNPLAILLLGIVQQFSSASPADAAFTFHLTDLLLHLLCSIGVFMLFRKLRLSAAAAFIGALFFAIHPMHIGAVAWVSATGDLLGSLFFIAALLCYSNYITGSNKQKWYIAAILCSLFSLLSGLQAIALPFLLLALDKYHERNKAAQQPTIAEKAPWWLMSVIAGVGWLLHNIGAASANRLAFTDRLLLHTEAIATYLLKWVWPYKMSHFYPASVHHTTAGYVLIGVALLVSVTAFRLAAKAQNRAILFGLSFFFINIVIAQLVAPSDLSFMADNYTYLSYTGLFFIVAYGFSTISANNKNALQTALFFIVVYALALTYTAYKQSKTWKSTMSLYENFIKCFPDSYYGFNEAGIYYLKKSFTISGNDNARLVYLNNAKKNFLDAYRADSMAGRPLPSVSSEIYQNAGIVSGLTGEKENAIRYFSNALALTPQNIEALKNRAYQYFLDGQKTLAIADYDKAIVLQPANSELYYLRANCYYALGNIATAKKDLVRAIELGSRDPNCYIAMSVIFRAENDAVHAREFAAKARDLGANVPEEYFR
jgi:tetratricopeptide (TPR) repeat protein